MKKIAFMLVAVAALAAIMLIHNAHAYSNSYGTISYNSGTNTITITGNSSDGDAWSFYDIWHWCNVDPGGNASLVISPDSDATHEGTQYYFAAKLQIGDGTTPTWFEDAGKQVYFNISGNTNIIHIKPNAHFTLGNQYNDGCSLYFYDEQDTTYNRQNILVDGEFNAYASLFQATGRGRYIKYTAGGSGELKYCTIENMRGLESWSTETTFDNINLLHTYIAYGNKGASSNISIYDANFGIIFRGTNDQIIKNVKASSISSKSIYFYTSDAGYDLYCIDFDLSKWNILYVYTKNGSIFRQYTFNPIITDMNGNAIQNAHVVLKDKDGNIVIDDYTDNSGRVLNGTEPYVVTYAVYNKIDGDTPHLQSPHHLVITKAGFAIYEANITIDHPFIDTPFVLDALTYTYDDIMAFLQEKWGDYNASQFMQYLQQIDANITQVYQLLQLVDGNLTDVTNLLEMVDGNVTAIYNLLKQVDANITSISSKLDIINTTVHNNYALLQEINVTTHATLNRWANLTATELHNLEKQTRDIAYYINSTRWAGYNFSDIMNKWGSYSASILYDVSNQSKEIADYINSTRWNTFVAEQLYGISKQAYQAANDAKNKWGSYTASDLYSISQNILSLSQEIKSIVIHINTSISNGFRVELTDFGRLQAGKTYHAQILVFNENGSMIDADAPPTIELYDPVGNKITTDTMTHEEEGRYTYDFTTATTHPGGTWTTIVTTTVNGKEVKNIDYWELITNPAKITVDVVDDVIPDITAKLTITNEGNTSQEYTYYYWITPRPDGEIGDNDTIDSGSASKLIQPGETFETYVTLTCENEGDYYFRARVYYGTEYSDAYQLFTAASSGGGGWVITGNEFIKYMWYFIAIIIFMFIVAIIAVLKAKSRKTRRRRR